MLGYVFDQYKMLDRWPEFNFPGVLWLIVSFIFLAIGILAGLAAFHQSFAQQYVPFKNPILPSLLKFDEQGI